MLAIALAGTALSPATAKLTEKQQEQKLKEYQRELAQAQVQGKMLGREISQTEFELASLRARVQGLEGEVALAGKEYEARLLEVEGTEATQDDVQGQLDETRSGMDRRIRAVYMQGPSGTLDLLLGATSITDLTEREAFVNALQAQDSNTAATLDTLDKELQDLRHEQKQLAHDSSKALRYVEQQQEALVEAREAAAAKVSDLAKKQHEAHLLETTWEHKVKVQTTKVGYYVGGPGPFYACPVPNYSWIADDFGAPRYGGGYHQHAGNDIGGAMGADLVAPFDGVAKDASNTLGGLSVYVYGKDGYVYNAHLSSFEGSLPRRVNAGEVIGHVGMTGDAQGTVPHDHFEWHPNDANGATTVNGAVDPNAELGEVCHR